MPDKKEPIRLRVIAGNRVTLPADWIKEKDIKEGDWVEIDGIKKLKLS